MNRKIGEILVQKGFCKEEDIEKALSIQDSYGGKIGRILINIGIITETHLIEALAEQFSLAWVKDINDKYEYVDIGLPVEFLMKNKIFPFKNENNKIHVFTHDPLMVDLFSFISVSLNKEVVLVLTTEANIDALFDNMVSGINSNNNHLDIVFDEEEIEKLKEIASEAPVIKLVNNILYKAVELGATDVHFESYTYGLKVRFRVDGRLYHIDTIPNNFKLPVIARLKLLSGMNIVEKRVPQDGRISMKIASTPIDIRASSVPTKFGESFVLRLLRRDDANFSLEDLGLYMDHVDLIREIIRKPYGLFLTTGPTGSGKTTTLYSILMELNNEEVKIMTVEDPVEYELPNISQVNVNHELGYTFSVALRSILRQDPDIIMIGEIRDRETAEIALRAALTGHLVLSTLHTNNALSSIIRLLDMGVDDFLLKSTVIGLMAQRLVRKLCNHCKSETDIDKQYKNLYKNIDHLVSKLKIDYKPAKPVGCEHCNYTGYKGRTIIAEVVPFQEEHVDFALKNVPVEELGYRNMLQDGILKVISGITTMDEVLKAIV